MPEPAKEVPAFFAGELSFLSNNAILLCKRKSWDEKMVYETYSAEETSALGEKIGREAKPGEVCTLVGDLGVGKTVLTQGIAKGLGITEPISSPTFTIVNEYEGPVPLFHFDMYRLEDSDALFDIGWEDYLARGGVCAVEWSERVEDALPEDTVWVTSTRHPDCDHWRTITITGGPTS